MNCPTTSNKWQCIDGFYWLGSDFRQLFDSLAVFSYS